jgi:AcrR family transcriptional regulator
LLPRCARPDFAYGASRISSPPLRPRDVSAEATRALIVREARAIFGRDGFGGAHLSGLAAAAGVTTGAIYHHFRDKKGLFQAVAESVEEDILAAVRAAAIAVAEQDPWEQLLAGVDATLVISAEPDVQRIIYVDAATVLGPTAWREIEMRYGFGSMLRAFAKLADAGIVRAASPEMLSAIVLGALIEAAKAVARAEDKRAALAEARATMRRIVESVRL